MEDAPERGRAGDLRVKAVGRFSLPLRTYTARVWLDLAGEELGSAEKEATRGPQWVFGAWNVRGLVQDAGWRLSLKIGAEDLQGAQLCASLHEGKLLVVSKVTGVDAEGFEAALYKLACAMAWDGRAEAYLKGKTDAP